MSGTGAGWVELGRLVRAERLRRHLSQAEFGDSLGLDRGTVLDIERGNKSNYQDATKQRVEDALGWEDGSFDRVANGQAPARKPDPEWDAIRQVWRELPIEVRQALARAANPSYGA